MPEVGGKGRGPGFWACQTGCTPEGAPVTWRRGLALVRAASGPRLVPRRGWQRYSTEVQQLTWTRADLRGRARTVTCGYGHGWTCCREMACKRSAVRARLAPPRSEALSPVAGEGLPPSEGQFEGQDRRCTLWAAPSVGSAGRLREVIRRPISARGPIGYPLRSVTQLSVRARGNDRPMMAAKRLPDDDEAAEGPALAAVNTVTFNGHQTRHHTGLL